MKVLNLIQYLSIGAIAILIGLPISTSTSTKVLSKDKQEIFGGKKSKKLFKKFLKSFPSQGLPYKVDQAELLKYRIDKNTTKSEMMELRQNQIPDEFAAYVPGLNQGKFSRMGPSTYRFEQLLAQTDDVVAVVISNDRGYRSNPSFVLYTYSTKGKLLTTKQLGWRSYNSITTASVDTNLDIEVNTHSIIRKKADKYRTVDYKKIIPAELLKLKSTINYVLDKKEGVVEGKKYASTQPQQQKAAELAVWDY